MQTPWSASAALTATRHGLRTTGAGRSPVGRPAGAAPARRRQRSGEDGFHAVLVHELDRCVLIFYGELDLASAPRAARSIAFAARPGGRVLVDLGELRFLDGRGLRVLVQAHRALGDRLSLRRGSEPFGRVLELSGLAAALPFVD